jgi:hypothetical protein
MNEEKMWLVGFPPVRRKWTHYHAIPIAPDEFAEMMALQKSGDLLSGEFIEGRLVLHLACDWECMDWWPESDALP